MKVSVADPAGSPLGAAPACLFCTGPGAAVVWRDARGRSVVAVEPLAGFRRAVPHGRERMHPRLGAGAHPKRVVSATQATLRNLLSLPKMTLARPGNPVSLVHWHVIPGFADDGPFPQPVSRESQQDGVARVRPARLEAALATRLAVELGASA